MMRKSLAFLLFPMLLAGCHPSQSFEEAFHPGTNPVLDSAAPRAGGTVDFRFHSADGNVVVLHREILDSPTPSAPSDVGIDLDSAQQKAGATFTDRGLCQGVAGRQTIRAYLIDGNHRHSNSVDYIVDCGG